MTIATMIRAEGDWSEGSLYIQPDPESDRHEPLIPYEVTWRGARNCRQVNEITHAAFRRCGLDPQEVTWHHVVMKPGTNESNEHAK